MRAWVLTTCALFAATATHAQVPNSSAAALGMAENYTTLARGYAVPAWNPALLARADNPRASLAILPVRTIAGLDPVTLADVADYGGRTLPADVRERWLQRIEQAGGEEGAGGGDVTWLAAQAGSFAFQVSSVVRARSDLSPGAAELLLFGNYGRTGEPRALQLDGSRGTAFALSSAALSYGRSVSPNVAWGVTLTYTVGHVLLHGADRGTAFTADPAATIDFPVVETRSVGLVEVNASGLGLDVGLVLQRAGWTVGATVRNAFNTFRWHERDLVFRAGAGRFDESTRQSDFAERDFSDAPQQLREFVEDARFRPVVGIGGTREMSHRLTVSADLRHQLGASSLDIAPRTHVGAGAEYRVTRRIPVRGGLAYVEDGYQVAGGAGLDFGPASIAAGFMRRAAGRGAETHVLLTLISTMPQ